MIKSETISINKDGMTTNEWMNHTGSLSFRWLGQAGFAFLYNDYQLFIDPYLSDFLAEKYKGTTFPHKRMMPVPFNLSEIKGLHFVLCTHGHSDHMDPGTLPILANNNKSCKFIVPAAETGLALERGVKPNQLLPVNANQEYQLASGISLTAIPSAHEQFQTNDKGEHFFLGYILKFGDITIYHSGDCVPFCGLTDLLKEQNVDLAFLPVNGRDEYRKSNGVPGNFTVQETIQIVKDSNIQHLVACHFGMFDFNTIDKIELVNAFKETEIGVKSVIPEAGKQYNVYVDN